MELRDNRSIRRAALRIAYDGTDFFGWQRQARGRTVQGELERMLGRLCSDRPVTVVGAGRTDSGVHAAGQVAHADVETRYDDAGLLAALRRMAPSDLAVRDLRTVEPDFHARFRACARSYRYCIINAPNPFVARYSWYHTIRFDLDLLNRVAESFLGQHDFTTFSKHNPDTPNPLCHVTEARWHREGERLVFRITADRFLYGMVRLIVGYQVDVALGKRRSDQVSRLLDERNRALQSMSAPAAGLSLMEVRYPDTIFPEDGSRV